MPGDSLLENMNSVLSEIEEEVKTETGDEEEEKIEDEEEGHEEEASTEAAADDEEDAEAEPENKGKKEDADETAVDFKDQKKVAEAFKNMRKQLKENERQLREEREEKQQLSLAKAKLEGFREATTPKAEENKTANEDPEPDANYDTLEWLKWNARQQNKAIEETKATAQKTASTQEADRVANAIKTQDADFERSVPAYKAAVDFYANKQIEIIKIQNPTLNAQQIQQKFIKDTQQLYLNEFRSGRIPGQTVLGLAKAFGFQEGNDKVNNKQGKGAPNIDNIKKNSRKSAPMTGSAQGKNGSQVDPEEIFSMSLNKLASKSESFFDLREREARNIDYDDM